MNSPISQAFARALDRFQRLSPDQRAERERQRKETAALNAKVTTRQVVRRKLFLIGFDKTTRTYALPRQQRRRIALSSMHRAWKESR